MSVRQRIAAALSDDWMAEYVWGDCTTVQVREHLTRKIGAVEEQAARELVRDLLGRAAAVKRQAEEAPIPRADYYWGQATAYEAAALLVQQRWSV